jgi:hypothetical protein
MYKSLPVHKKFTEHSPEQPFGGIKMAAILAASHFIDYLTSWLLSQDLEPSIKHIFNNLRVRG